MNPGLIAFLLFAAVLFVAITVVLVVAFRSKVVWSTVPGWPGVLVSGHYRLDTLVDALSRARTELLTLFKAEDVDAMFSDLRIVVMNEMSWLSGGVAVGGEGIGQNGVKVCRDLSSLFHELVHVMEFRLYHFTDYNHIHWIASVWNCDNRFRLSCEQQSPWYVA